MNLSSMRYKDYVWPHNPRVYEIAWSMEVAAHRVPFGDYALQQMGRRHRVLRGEGEFGGRGAYEEFRRLAAVFREREPGVLVHPLWTTTKAYFTALRLRQEPTADYVAYSFEFWECGDSYPGSIVPTAPLSVAPAAVVESVAAQSPVQDTGSGSAEKNVAASYLAKFGEAFWNVAHNLGQTVEELLKNNEDIRNINECGDGGGQWYLCTK